MEIYGWKWFTWQLATLGDRTMCCGMAQCCQLCNSSVKAMSRCCRPTWFKHVQARFGHIKFHHSLCTFNVRHWLDFIPGQWFVDQFLFYVTPFAHPLSLDLVHPFNHSIFEWFPHPFTHAPIDSFVHLSFSHASISVHVISSYQVMQAIHVISSRSFIHSHMPAINHSSLAPFPSSLASFKPHSSIHLFVALWLPSFHPSITESPSWTKCDITDGPIHADSRHAWNNMEKHAKKWNFARGR